MRITLAETEAERREVLALFLETFQDIAATAVPMPDFDHLYRPLIAQVRDDSGMLLAAALTCAPQKAAGMALMPERMRPPGLSKAAERVSELDLMAVHPEHRGHGMGQQMIEFLEPLLVSRGVRSWFGTATPDLDVDALRRFYVRAGFRVLAEGQALPPLGGQDWGIPFYGTARLLLLEATSRHFLSQGIHACDRVETRLAPVVAMNETPRAYGPRISSDARAS